MRSNPTQSTLEFQGNAASLRVAVAALCQALSHIYNAAVIITLTRNPLVSAWRRMHHLFSSGSSKIPSASNRLRASSSAQVCILYCISTAPQQKSRRQWSGESHTSYQACSSSRSRQTQDSHKSRKTTRPPTPPSRTSRQASLQRASRRGGRSGLRVRGRPRCERRWTRGFSERMRMWVRRGR